MTKIGVDLEEKKEKPTVEVIDVGVPNDGYNYDPEKPPITGEVVTAFAPEGCPLHKTDVKSQPTGLTNPPKDYVWSGILTALCCCWPISILAIMSSLASRDAARKGDRETAVRQSRRAKRFNIASVVVGVLFTLVVMASVYGLIYCKGSPIRHLILRLRHQEQAPHDNDNANLLHHTLQGHLRPSGGQGAINRLLITVQRGNFGEITAHVRLLVSNLRGGKVDLNALRADIEALLANIRRGAYPQLRLQLDALVRQLLGGRAPGSLHTLTHISQAVLSRCDIGRLLQLLSAECRAALLEAARRG